MYLALKGRNPTQKIRSAKLAGMILACIPSTWEREVGASEVQGPGQATMRPLSQNETQKQVGESTHILKKLIKDKASETAQRVKALLLLGLRT